MTFFILQEYYYYKQTYQLHYLLIVILEITTLLLVIIFGKIFSTNVNNICNRILCMQNPVSVPPRRSERENSNGCRYCNYDVKTNNHYIALEKKLSSIIVFSCSLKLTISILVFFFITYIFFCNVNGSDYFYINTIVNSLGSFTLMSAISLWIINSSPTKTTIQCYSFNSQLFVFIVSIVVGQSMKLICNFNIEYYTDGKLKVFINATMQIFVSIFVCTRIMKNFYTKRTINNDTLSSARGTPEFAYIEWTCTHTYPSDNSTLLNNYHRAIINYVNKSGVFSLYRLPQFNNVFDKEVKGITFSQLIVSSILLTLSLVVCLIDQARNQNSYISYINENYREIPIIISYLVVSISMIFLFIIHQFFIKKLCVRISSLICIALALLLRIIVTLLTNYPSNCRILTMKIAEIAVIKSITLLLFIAIVLFIYNEYKELYIYVVQWRTIYMMIYLISIFFYVFLMQHNNIIVLQYQPNIIVHSSRKIFNLYTTTMYSFLLIAYGILRSVRHKPNNNFVI